MPSPRVALAIVTSGPSSPIPAPRAEPSAPRSSTLARRAASPMSLLFTTTMSGILHDPGLQKLERIPRSGLHDEDDRVHHVLHVRLALTDADRLDEHPVEGRREHDGRRRSGASQAAEMPRRRQASYEQAMIVGSAVDASAVAEERPAGALARGIDGQDAHGGVRTAQRLSQRVDQAALADARGACESDAPSLRLAAPERPEQGGHARARFLASVLYEVQPAGHGAPFTRPDADRKRLESGVFTIPPVPSVRASGRVS